jgi:ATP-dependent DNA ligase
VRFSDDLPGSADVVMQAVREQELEGIVAKRRASFYEPGKRTGARVKLHLKPKQEFVIGGYRPEGSTLELILIGYYERKKLLFAGKVRQGLNPGLRHKLLTIFKPLSTVRCHFVNLPTSKTGHWGEGVTAEDMKDYVWVKPEIVAEIKFTEWTTGSVLRHAEFVDLRDDKAPEDVSRES